MSTTVGRPPVRNTYVDFRSGTENSLRGTPSSQRDLPPSFKELLDNSEKRDGLLDDLGYATPDFKKFVLENESVLTMNCSAAL
eukprot:2468326-Heterocapsa_arctica.AAC.1